MKSQGPEQLVGGKTSLATLTQRYCSAMRKYAGSWRSGRVVECAGLARRINNYLGEVSPKFVEQILAEKPLGFYVLRKISPGGVAEWLNALVSKTSGGLVSLRGSNPLSSVFFTLSKTYGALKITRQEDYEQDITTET